MPHPPIACISLTLLHRADDEDDEDVDDDEGVMELVLQHPFYEGETHDEDQALAAAAQVLAEEPGHCMDLYGLAYQMRQREPNLS